MNIKKVESVLQSVNLPMESLVFGDNYMVGNLSGFKTLMSKIKELPLFQAPQRIIACLLHLQHQRRLRQSAGF
jgi:hypothetical protein